MLGDYKHISEGDTVKTTGRILEVPVGTGLLGRVEPLHIDLDGLEERLRGPAYDRFNASLVEVGYRAKLGHADEVLAIHETYAAEFQTLDHDASIILETALPGTGAGEGRRMERGGSARLTSPVRPRSPSRPAGRPARCG